MADYDELVKRLRQQNGSTDYRFLMRDAADAIEELRGELKTCRNELCLYCGQYKQRHLGACDDCRWRD